MKTTNPITNETERGFRILISKIKGKKALDAKPKNQFYYNRKESANSCYPFFNGQEAIEGMRALIDRGFDAVACTEGNGVEEFLTLEEMTQLYIPKEKIP